MATTDKKIVVLGSTGFIGSATIKALSAAGGASVLAGVRNTGSEKAAPLGELPHVSLVTADLASPDSLKEAVAGATAVFVVTPGAEDRAALALNGYKAAAEAGAHAVIVSVSTVELTDTIFGRQFTELETAVKDIGSPYTFLRLALFTDNNWAHAGSVKSDGKFYGPADPSKSFTTVTVQDVADSAAAVLLNPAAHVNKTYDLAGPATTHTEMAAAFSSALGKTVEYVQVPYAAAKESFMGMGFPEWQTDGVLELYHLVDEDKYRYPSQIKDLTGRDATSFADWIAAVKDGFQ